MNPAVSAQERQERQEFGGRAILDTSVLVRYLTFDPPEQGVIAQALIEGDEELMIPSVALAETAFALTRRYGVERAQTVDLLVDLISRENIRVQDLPNVLAIEAFQLCRPSGRVSYADALIWAATRQAGVNAVYTFDRAFPSSGVERRLLAAAATDEASQT